LIPYVDAWRCQKAELRESHLWGRIALSFAILETIALIDRKTEDTLSEAAGRWSWTSAAR